MFRGVITQILEEGLVICDLYQLREFFVEANSTSAFSLGDKVYVQYTENVGKKAAFAQVTTDILKVDKW